MFALEARDAHLELLARLAEDGLIARAKLTVVGKDDLLGHQVSDVHPLREAAAKILQLGGHELMNRVASTCVVSSRALSHNKHGRD